MHLRRVHVVQTNTVHSSKVYLRAWALLFVYLYYSIRLFNNKLFNHSDENIRRENLKAVDAFNHF